MHLSQTTAHNQQEERLDFHTYNSKNCYFPTDRQLRIGMRKEEVTIIILPNAALSGSARDDFM